MPPPTPNMATDPAVQTGESQISGPDNTTGQDFIFSPRTTTKVGDSESTVSDDESCFLLSNRSMSKPGNNKRLLQAKAIKQRKAERAERAKGLGNDRGKMSQNQFKSGRKEGLPTKRMLDRESKSIHDGPGRPAPKSPRRCCAIS